MRWPARPNNAIVIQASNPRIPKTGGLYLAKTGDAGAGGVCFDAGPEGTGGRGARLLPQEVGPNRWRAWSAVAGQQNGPAPPPRSAGPPKPRIVSEDRGTVHAHSGPSSLSALVGHEEARRTWEGGNRGPPGLTIFYYPTGRGPNTKGAETPAKARPMGVCFGEPPTGVRGIRLPRTRVNRARRRAGGCYPPDRKSRGTSYR